MRACAAVETAKGILANRQQDFASAIGAEIEAEEAVAILCTAVSADDRRRDEFVGFAARIGSVDSGSGSLGGLARRRLTLIPNT